MKRYALVICKDEPEESIVFADLNEEVVDEIRKDMNGSSKNLVIETIDGESIEIGIIDDIHESVGECKKCGESLFPSFVPGYSTQCFCCDEDFYDFEQNTGISKP